MPTYSEIAHLLQGQPNSLDGLRLYFMQQLVAHTKRPLVVYAANPNPPVNCSSLMIDDTDMRALMDMLRGVKGDSLDLMLHSDGGSPDAADTFVSYLREKFKHIRVIVPEKAMSAATMIACGANELLLAKHSFLGPIDLQFNTPNGMIAAQDVLDQYELIRKEIPNATEFWGGAGSKLYFPVLVVQMRNALEYGRQVVERHLREVMFAKKPDAAKRAAQIADDLANHRKHKSHGRRLSRRYLKDLGLVITDLESDNKLQDLVLSVHHCIMHTFAAVPALTKLVQNHLGKVVPTFNKHAKMKPQDPPTPAPTPDSSAPDPAPGPGPEPVTTNPAPPEPVTTEPEPVTTEPEPEPEPKLKRAPKPRK